MCHYAGMYCTTSVPVAASSGSIIKLVLQYVPSRWVIVAVIGDDAGIECSVTAPSLTKVICALPATKNHILPIMVASPWTVVLFVERSTTLYNHRVGLLILYTCSRFALPVGG